MGSPTIYIRNLCKTYIVTEREAGVVAALVLAGQCIALKPLESFFQSKTWRERIRASFGYDPLQCPRYGHTPELVEIWEPKRGHVWMKRWLETHRLRKAARQAMGQLRSVLPRYRQLAFDFNSG